MPDGLTWRTLLFAAWEEIRDQTLHFARAALVASPVAYCGAPVLACALVGFLGSVVREAEQHRDEGWIACVWGGYWRWVHIAFGTLGGAMIGAWL